MPRGKGYGSKAGAKKKENPFAKKAAAGKGAAKKMPAFLQKKGAAKPAAKGKKALPPALAKKAAEMKKKSAKKK